MSEEEHPEPEQLTDRASNSLRNFLLTLALSSAFYGLYPHLEGTFSAYWYELPLELVNERKFPRHDEYAFVVLQLLLPAVWWHTMDIFRRPDVALQEQSHFQFYRLVLALLIYGLVGGALIFSGVMEVVACWQPTPPASENGLNFIFFCDPSPAHGWVPLVLLPSVCLLVLAVGKTVQTIKNRRTSCP